MTNREEKLFDVLTEIRKVCAEVSPPSPAVGHIRAIVDEALTVTADELWAKVQRDWPEAVRLDASTMLVWANDPHDLRDKVERFRKIALALQYPVHVFYATTNDSKGAIGCRYGMDGPDYLSGFQ